MSLFKNLDYPSEYELCRELRINVLTMPETLDSISHIFLHFTDSVFHHTFVDPNTWLL